MKTWGLKRSLQNMIGLIQDRRFDRSLGVRTEGKVFLKDLGVTSEYLKKDDRPRRYKATKAMAFRKLTQALALPKEHVFVDLGSGMGRMLLLAMEYGFTRAVGVEISGYLCQIARENVATYQKTHRTRTQIDIVESDVVAYEIQDDETVYYLFHPFGEEVMGQFFDNLRQSLRRKDREVWIIYNNPVYQEVLHSIEFLDGFCTFVYGDSTFQIYRHRVSVKEQELETMAAVSWWSVPQPAGRGG